jgi:hypothetical protein
VKRQVVVKKHVRAVSTFTGGEFVLSKLLEDQSAAISSSTSSPTLATNQPSTVATTTNPSTVISSSSSDSSTTSSSSSSSSSSVICASSSSTTSTILPPINSPPSAAVARLSHKSNGSISGLPGHRSTPSGGTLTLSPYTSHAGATSSSGGSRPMLLFNSDSQFEGVVLGGGGSGFNSQRSDRSPSDGGQSIQSRWRVLTAEEAADRKLRNDSLTTSNGSTTSTASLMGVTTLLSTTATNSSDLTLPDDGSPLRLRSPSNGNGNVSRARGARIMTISTKPQSQPNSQVGDDSPALTNNNSNNNNNNGTASARGSALDMPSNLGVDSGGTRSSGGGTRRSTNRGQPRSISFAKDANGVPSVAEESKETSAPSPSPRSNGELQLMSVSRVDTKDFTASTSHLGGIDSRNGGNGANDTINEYEGEDFVISYLGPGNYFGEASLIQDAPRAATVTAVTRCAVVSLTKANFEEFFRHCPEAFSNFQVKLARYDVKLNHLLFHPIGMDLFTKHLIAEHSEENINVSNMHRPKHPLIFSRRSYNFDMFCVVLEASTIVL